VTVAVLTDFITLIGGFGDRVIKIFSLFKKIFVVSRSY